MEFHARRNVYFIPFAQDTRALRRKLYKTPKPWKCIMKINKFCGDQIKIAFKSFTLSGRQRAWLHIRIYLVKNCIWVKLLCLTIWIWNKASKVIHCFERIMKLLCLTIWIWNKASKVIHCFQIVMKLSF